MNHFLRCPVCGVFGRRRRARITRQHADGMLMAFHAKLVSDLKGRAGACE